MEYLDEKERILELKQAKNDICHREQKNNIDLNFTLPCVKTSWFCPDLLYEILKELYSYQIYWQSILVYDPDSEDPQDGDVRVGRSF